ncbi:TPA: hypothetical protein QDZ66_003245 [Pluralibacter gergoviae]|uniref:hypothetical protein n=1 Tax=Pluralibacter gergoviae TaxID=61647 RepID=UPI000A8A43EB|nr:hypothetical protein [Pluralibacter gergoviae]MBL3694074.1 hypothetical protein [Pluralibacter gergoviae]HDS1152453.1 hypothetical protein [Pluralibacter gergoviae]
MSLPSNFMGTNAVVFKEKSIANGIHTFNHAGNILIFKKCQLHRAGLDLNDSVNKSLILDIARSDVISTTIISKGSLYIYSSYLHKARISVSGTLQIEHSSIKKSYLRLQSGTSLHLFKNETDEIHVEGEGTFSHLVSLNGLFTRCVFKELSVFNGNLNGIFYQTRWINSIFRESTFINSIFNQCYMSNVVIRDSTLINITISFCDIIDGSIIFENCDIKALRIINIPKNNLCFINCTGLSTII